MTDLRKELERLLEYSSTEGVELWELREELGALLEKLEQQERSLSIATSKAQLDQKAIFEHYNLGHLYGAKFFDKAYEYEVIGWRKQARKNKISIRRLQDGKTFCCRLEYVREKINKTLMSMK